jgi:alkanesulfonate monooxygenase SsuD/methylene tetrahydromethanopterin reductase-like flavin-dependent oxidoreductase (luciferase family)
MALLTMRHDFRVAPDGAASRRDIYQAALEQFVWADAHDFPILVLSEHHGLADGWMPAPLTMAGAVLGSTKQARVVVSASILPLHDPVRVAEQISVLDNTFPGRLWVVFGAGYRVEEFEMAGVEHAARGRLLEEYVRVVRDALTGETFEWQGRTIQSTPASITPPENLLFVGGGVPAAARRAARLHLPMFPMNTDAAVRDAYYEEAKRVGFDRPFLIEPGGPTFVYVDDDPDAAWEKIGPYVLYEVQTYTSFQTEGQHSLPGVHAEGLEDLKRSPQYLVGTPDDVLEAIKALPPMAGVVFHPLAGGMPPALAWPSLERFAAKVQPRL